ncbi:MAG: pyruvate kinase [Legionellales bacterium]|nr:pyruvate kinase [Legionellales bacterium]
MLRRTKIIATLGPATDDPMVLENMIKAGLDVVRLNFSHGSKEDHAKRIQMVRELAKKHQKHISVLSDLQGPKIRIARFKNNKITLKKGAKFILDANLEVNAGDELQVGIDYKELPNDVRAGDILLLNDGLMEFVVDKVHDQKIYCEVLVDGELSNNKGINRQGGGLSAKALTDKDKADLNIAVELGTDYLALSFPRNAEDVLEAKQLLTQAGSTAGVIAKVERVEAITAIDEIIDASDGVMVARGDLGVEIGDAELPAVQKHIIHQCRYRNKPVITATQMMESMIANPIPTRAEVFDVANAVLDGTDCVMLSAETATGHNPVKVIQAMSRICLGAEKNRINLQSRNRMEVEIKRFDEAIAMSTMYCANHYNIKSIIALTESGSTPLWMSRIRSGIPIYGLTRSDQTLQKINLYRGVYPVKFDLSTMSPEEVNRAAVAELEKRNIVQKGDWVIITRGDLLGQHGHTNSLKIVEVGNVY